MPATIPAKGMPQITGFLIVALTMIEMFSIPKR